MSGKEKESSRTSGESVVSNSEKDSFAELRDIAVPQIGTFIFSPCPTFLFPRKLQF